jgi:dTMP kinase
MIFSRGYFIAIEGLEGAGKTTALSTAKRYLIDHVPDIQMTREPGGTMVGETVRQLIKETNCNEVLDPRAELLLFYAARVQLAEQVTRPALERGTWILSDRCELSTFAYQGAGRKLELSMIQHLSHFCLGNLQPDLILFLDIPPELGLERARQRGKMDRIEQEALAFFQDVYAGYHSIIKTMNNVVVIDAAQPMADVQSMIRFQLKQFLIRYALPENA